MSRNGSAVWCRRSFLFSGRWGIFDIQCLLLLLSHYRSRRDGSVGISIPCSSGFFSNKGIYTLYRTNRRGLLILLLLPCKQSTEDRTLLLLLTALVICRITPITARRTFFAQFCRLLFVVCCRADRRRHFVFTPRFLLHRIIRGFVVTNPPSFLLDNDGG